MVTAYFGVFLLAMQLSQVQAQNTTLQSPAVNTNMTEAGGKSSNMTAMPYVVTTTNITILKGASASLLSSAFTLLITMAVTASLLQGHF